MTRTFEHSAALFAAVLIMIVTFVPVVIVPSTQTVAAATVLA